MGQIIRVSEAAAIAMHSAIILAHERPNSVSLGELAEILQSSRAHCSKVLQRLCKSGLLEAIRGPKGGYVLSKDPAEVTLLQFYEAIEGRLEDTWCLFGEQRCRFGFACCLFEKKLTKANELIRSALGITLDEGTKECCSALESFLPAKDQR